MRGAGGDGSKGDGTGDGYTTGLEGKRNVAETKGGAGPCNKRRTADDSAVAEEGATGRAKYSHGGRSTNPG